MAAPRKGEIVDGYEFTGGDPNDERSWQYWGEGARALPTGEIVQQGPKGGLKTLRKASAGVGGVTEPLREFEVNAAARATLMDQGLRDYQAAVKSGYNPGSFRNTLARGVEGMPYLGGDFTANLLRDNPSEKARAAELQFIDGALRTTSGANAPEPEVIRASKAYFRQPGEAPEVERGKSALRERFRTQAIRTAGNAYVAPGPEETARTPVPKAALRAHAAFMGTPDYNPQAPRGSKGNPYVARDLDTARRLPAGSVVVLPDGSIAVRN